MYGPDTMRSMRAHERSKCRANKMDKNEVQEFVHADKWKAEFDDDTDGVIAEWLDRIYEGGTGQGGIREIDMVMVRCAGCRWGRIRAGI